MLTRWTDILVFSLCLGVVCLAASIQMGLLLGVALHPTLYVLPVCVGVLFGTMLVAVRRLWRRSQVANEQAQQSALALNQANEALKNLNAVLEERVAERSRQVVSQAEELQTARQSVTLGLLAGGVAHDINGLLTIIVTRIDELSELQEPAIQEAVTDIAQACERGSELARRLLRTADRSLETQTVDVAAALVGMEALCRSALRPGQQLVLSLQGGGAVRIAASALDQVVLNLVMNARDAMDRGRIEVGCADEGACVRIWVQDEGSGIADAVRDQVFEPFVTTKAQGTGLGLASVRELVHEAQGEITFTTSPQGTRFDVTLPSLSAGEPGAP